MKMVEIDFTVANATAGVGRTMSASAHLVSVELGYLVPANSLITRADEIDRPGVRMGFTKGSTSERTLPAKFKNAKIVPAENVKVAVEMLRPRRARHLCNQQTHAVRNVGFDAGRTGSG